MIIEDIKKVAEKMGGRMVVATVDSTGVVNLAPEFITEITNDHVYFQKFPRSKTLDNLKVFPKASIAIVDWNSFSGFQIKGLLETIENYTPTSEAGQAIYQRLTGLGCNQSVRISITEVFDVLPKSGAIDYLWSNPKHTDYFKLRYEARPYIVPKFSPANLSQIVPELNSHINTMLDLKYNSYVGTVERNGTPNVSPRFILEANNEHLLWGDKFKNKTFLNFSRPSPITIALINWQAENGYQLKGWGSFHFFGESINKVNDYWKKHSMKDPLQAVHFYPAEMEQLKIGKPVEVWRGFEREEWMSGILTPGASRKTSYLPSLSSNESNNSGTSVLVAGYGLSSSIELKTKPIQLQNSQTIPTLSPMHKTLIIPEFLQPTGGDLFKESVKKTGDILQWIHGVFSKENHIKSVIIPIHDHFLNDFKFGIFKDQINDLLRHYRVLNRQTFDIHWIPFNESNKSSSGISDSINLLLS